MKIEESISKLKRFKYHAIGRLELEDAIDDVVSWYEQMLKDAVEGEYDQYPAAIYLSVPIPRMNQGDKVKLIIVKED